MSNLIPVKSANSFENILNFLQQNEKVYCYNAMLVKVELQGGELEGFLVTESSQREADETTLGFLNALIKLLDRSPVKYILQNNHCYESFLPNFLLWLDYDVNADALAIKQTPSHHSLLNTFFAASEQKTLHDSLESNQRIMYGRILLRAPQNITKDQLKYVLYFFAETARHHFRLLSSNGVDIINFDKSSSKSKLDMLVKHVSPDSPYTVELWDMYNNVVLYSHEIDNAMRQLSSSDEVLPFGRSVSLVEAFNTLACQWVSASEFLLSLSVYGNTYEFADNANKYEGMFYFDCQLEKMLKKRDLQAIEGTPWLASVDSSKADNMLNHIRYHARSLYVVPQADLSKWVVDVPVETLNLSTHLLLQKIHKDEPISLLGSKEIIESISCILHFILNGETLGNGSLDILDIINADDVAVLRKVTVFLSMLPASFFKERPSDSEIVNFIGSSTDLTRADRKLFAKDPYFFYKLAFEIVSLLQCCFELEAVKSVPLVREKLKKLYSLQTFSSYEIPYPAKETTYIILYTLHLLSKLYTYFAPDGDPYKSMRRLKKCNEWLDEKAFKHFDALLCDGIFPLFMLQKYVTVRHINKSAGIPLNIVGISFSMDNKHDGFNMSPSFLCMHDVCFHPYFINSILDGRWKTLYNKGFRDLSAHLTAVLSHLDQQDNSYAFLGEKLLAKTLSKLLDYLFFGIWHENSTSEANNSNSRARLSPQAPASCDFLEKALIFFLELGTQNLVLGMRNGFSDIASEIKALFPICKYDSAPYFMACCLLEIIVLQSRACENKAAHFSVHDAMIAFEKKLVVEENFLRLLAQNWEVLIDRGVLPITFRTRLDGERERIRLLMLPNVQRRIKRACIDWDMGKVPVNRLALKA